MPTFDINLWAVLVAGLVPMVLGMVWYSPSVLGTIWMKESGRTTADIQAKKNDMGWAYFAALIGALLTSYVLAHFIDLAGAMTVGDGLELAIWVWLGIIAPVMLGSVLWDGKSIKYFAITAGYQLVSVALICTILTLWQ